MAAPVRIGRCLQMRESEIIFKLISAEDIPRLKEIMIDDGGCYNAEQLKRFMEHRDIVAFGAFLDNQIIGLIYGYSLCQISDERPQFFIYSVGIHSNYQKKDMAVNSFSMLLIIAVITAMPRYLFLPIKEM